MFGYPTPKKFHPKSPYLKGATGTDTVWPLLRGGKPCVGKTAGIWVAGTPLNIFEIFFNKKMQTGEKNLDFHWLRSREAEHRRTGPCTTDPEQPRGSVPRIILPEWESWWAHTAYAIGRNHVPL